MKELHLICNAHLDPVWQWDWNEGATAGIGMACGGGLWLIAILATVILVLV